MSASTSPRPEHAFADEDAAEIRAGDVANPAPDAFPALPTETEIYILPDGRVIVADLPVELAPLADALGSESREAPARS